MEKKDILDFALFCSNYIRISGNTFKHPYTSEELTIEEMYDDYVKNFKNTLISIVNYDEQMFQNCDKILIFVEYFCLNDRVIKKQTFKVEVEALFSPIMEVKNKMEKYIKDNKELKIVAIKPITE